MVTKAEKKALKSMKKADVAENKVKATDAEKTSGVEAPVAEKAKVAGVEEAHETVEKDEAESADKAKKTIEKLEVDSKKEAAK